MTGILGKKLGMTQIFAEDGIAHPVTVIEAGPCLVVQRKNADNDGYEAVQIGLVENRPYKRVSQPLAGHFKKGGVSPMRQLVEFQVEADQLVIHGEMTIQHADFGLTPYSAAGGLIKVAEELQLRFSLVAHQM